MLYHVISVSISYYYKYCQRKKPADLSSFVQGTGKGLQNVWSGPEFRTHHCWSLPSTTVKVSTGFSSPIWQHQPQWTIIKPQSEWWVDLHRKTHALKFTQPTNLNGFWNWGFIHVHPRMECASVGGISIKFVWWLRPARSNALKSGRHGELGWANGVRPWISCRRM